MLFLWYLVVCFCSNHWNYDEFTELLTMFSMVLMMSYSQRILRTTYFQSTLGNCFIYGQYKIEIQKSQL